MMKKSTKPWKIIMACPYCKEVIVEARNHSLQPDNGMVQSDAKNRRGL